MNYNELGSAILESIGKVKSMGYTVLYAANYGSHNYNLVIDNENYHSDIDTKVIVLPTLEELVHNSKPVSTTIEISTGQCDIKDIRAFVGTLLKCNIQFLEILGAQSYWINPLYEEDFIWFIKNLDALIYENKNALLRSIKGMCFEKRNALCHPYPTIKWKIDKWGYDGKQLHHIIRLKDFIDNYFYHKQDFIKAIWYKDNDIRRDLLFKAKLNEFSLKQALELTENYCDLVNREVDQLIDEDNKRHIISENFRKKTEELIIKNIKKRILEEK